MRSRLNENQGKPPVFLFSIRRQFITPKFVITERCYASAVLAMALCVSVRLSQVGVLLKRLNVGSHKQHHK